MPYGFKYEYENTDFAQISTIRKPYFWMPKSVFSYFSLFSFKCQKTVFHLDFSFSFKNVADDDVTLKVRKFGSWLELISSSVTFEKNIRLSAVCVSVHEHGSYVWWRQREIIKVTFSHPKVTIPSGLFSSSQEMGDGLPAWISEIFMKNNKTLFNSAQAYSFYVYVNALGYVGGLGHRFLLGG